MPEGSDPAAVIYDAVAAAKSRKADVLICDTAGRLHNKKNLMEELKKINRIIDKEYPDAYRETLVVTLPYRRTGASLSSFRVAFISSPFLQPGTRNAG